METPFLVNRPYDFYENTPLSFTIYLCKDCRVKKKEYEIAKYLDEDIIPKQILNYGYVDLFAGRLRLKVKTPIMVCPFGFNKQTNQLYLQFSNLKTDAYMMGFYEFIQGIEMQHMEYLGLSETEVDEYISQIKYDKQGKYDPNLVVKVPFSSNKYNVDVRNKEKYCSVSQLFNFSKLQCDIYIDKIWKYNGKFVCKWKVDKIFISS